MAKFPARLPRSRLKKPRSRRPSQPALSYEHVEIFLKGSRDVPRSRKPGQPGQPGSYEEALIICWLLITVTVLVRIWISSFVTHLWVTNLYESLTTEKNWKCRTKIDFRVLWDQSISLRVMRYMCNLMKYPERYLFIYLFIYFINLLWYCSERSIRSKVKSNFHLVWYFSTFLCDSMETLGQVIHGRAPYSHPYIYCNKLHVINTKHPSCIICLHIIPFHLHSCSYTPFQLQLGSYTPFQHSFGFIYPIPHSFGFIYPIPTSIGSIYPIPHSFGFASEKQKKKQQQQTNKQKKKKKKGTNCALLLVHIDLKRALLLKHTVLCSTYFSKFLQSSWVYC